jgi:hypothetical protein
MIILVTTHRQALGSPNLVPKSTSNNLHGKRPDQALSVVMALCELLTCLRV